MSQTIEIIITIAIVIITQHQYQEVVEPVLDK